MSNFNVASDIIKMITKRGFEADVVICESDEMSVSQRLLKVEEITRAKNCTLGIRVIVNGTKSACISVNNFDKISDVVDNVIEMAKLTPEDRYLSLARVDQYVHDPLLSLDISDKQVVQIEDLLKIVDVIEKTALNNSGVTNSEGASASCSSTSTILATSAGFINSYHRTLYSASVSVIAGQDNGMETDYDYSVACHLSGLKSSEVLGETAAKRAVARLNARKIRTCKAPVIFENRIAKSLLKSIASAMNGNSIANATSFLVDKLDTPVFNSSISIVDDPLMLGGISSYPFDGEAIAGQKKYIVKDGIIKNWIMNLRAANQLGLHTTGNATRGVNGSVGIGVSNFYLENGTTSVAGLMSDIKEGLYVTDLFGFGVNLITGDYSQGAMGFWIEKGKIKYPVHEITIADNLLEMFGKMIVADDLVFCSSINSPTIRIDNMTIAGC